MKQSELQTTLLAVAAGIAFTLTSHAQSVDALLNKLVDKGVLTVKEARELREEGDKKPAAPAAARREMPEWVSALKFSGDLRGRFEGFYGANPAFVDRDRFRYRMRFGVTAILLDDMEVGLRLTSSEASGAFGGDPISGNATFADNASKKFVYFDLAYGKWSPIHTADWAGALTFGKMENPFHFPSTMMFDRDYTPEGAAAQLTYTLNKHHSLKFNGGAFVLDELSASGRDPWLAGAQWRWDANWNPHLATTLGIAGFGIGNDENLINGNVPNGNRGNTRNAAGAPMFNFNPIYLDAGVTWTLEKFPCYPGAFPIHVSGDYVNNPAAPRDHQGYSAGIAFGKAGKKRTWELAYRYESLGADAWFEEFPESDFGAFYQVQQPNAGFTAPGAGYGAGTNVRGHWVKLSYSPYDSFTLGVACFFTELIHPSPAGSETGMTRLQVDGVWKF
ncbi:MAG: hypothetical protein EXS35_03680 [Pedosphaera sp.]|nr:hypothetical protein [Pedosphaera sp.]